MHSLIALLPLGVFLLFSLGMSVYARRHAQRAGKGFVSEYFLGSRTLGGFMLAMTTVATYGSVSSFVGGPGQAWLVGYGWAYMAVVQVTSLIMLYGIVGKKMALISRRLGAVTVVDVIRKRYGSDALANLSALIMVVFFSATMVAQFVGGAKLFEAVTGYSYTTGLVLFGVAVILFATVGGFRGVTLVDAVCGIVMLLGVAVLAGGVLHAGGGYESIMASIAERRPEMLEPFSGGTMPAGLYFTQWLLVGTLTFVLPQQAVRTMGSRNTKSFRRAIVMGTVIVGAMMVGVTSIGVLSAGVLTGSLADYGASVDNIIPTAIAQTLPPLLAGVAIIGPIAASISTVASLLVVSSSAVMSDVYLHYCERAGRLPGFRTVSFGSRFVTFGIGVVVFVLAVVPPDVIWKINMFAFGGLETAFLGVLVGGLFWKRANRTGALLSMAGGTVAYCTAMACGFTIGGLHQIVIGVAVSAVLLVVGSLATRHAPSAQLEAFFPEDALGEEAETARGAIRER